MLVKCAWCKNTFNSERYGRQFCPHCGAELELAVPGGGDEQQVRVVRPGVGEGVAEGEVEQPPERELPPAPAPPPAPGGYGAYGGPGWNGSFAPAQDQPSPWERREELGAVNALIATWKQACLKPEQFFSTLRPEGLGSAFYYGWIFSALGVFLSSFWNLLLAVAMSNDESPSIAFGQLVTAPILAAISLWIAAAILYVGCLLFRCSDRGFDASFRAIAYSQGPQILAIIPGIGLLISWIWSLVLTIIAVKNMQRTTSGRAAGAVLLPGILIVTLCGCAAAILFAAGFGALAGAGGFK